MNHNAYHHFFCRWAMMAAGVLAVVFLPVSARCADETSAPEPLTLEQAVAIAVANSRTLKSADLAANNAEKSVKLARIKGRPSLNIVAAGTQLLQPVDFNFPKGAFGTFPQFGPFPPTDTTVTSPANFSVLANASLIQPITQLTRVRLGVRMQQAAAEISREDWRTQRNALVANVQQLYYGIAQLQSARDTAAESITFLTELKRFVSTNVQQGTALDADLLEVQARLARQRQTSASLEHALQNTKEQLNVALGRDVATPFTITAVPAAAMPTDSLAELQAQAVRARPEIHQATLKTQIARDDAQSTRSESIPDVSVGISYTQQLDIAVVPQRIVSAGVIVCWQDPVDWGRRRLEREQKATTIVQADTGLAEARARVQADVNARYRALQDALALLDADRVEIHAQEEKRRVTMNRYTESTNLLKDVLEADTALANAHRQYLQDQLDASTARAKLDEAIGGE